MADTDETQRVAPSINIERAIADHVPTRIAELERDIDTTVATLIALETELVRLRIHERITTTE